MSDQISSWFVFVGTYTRSEPHVEGKAKGIYLYRLDGATGALQYVSMTSSPDNPSFLALHPQGHFLYAVHELGEYDGGPGGAVTAYEIDPQTGDLALLNQQSSEGNGPCHVVVDETGRFLLVANYVSGSLAILPIAPDGSLQPATDVVQHEGSSVNPQRQEGPHAHSVTLDSSNRFLVAADLGLDKLLVYRPDWTQGKLVPNDPPWVQVRPGAGPRHFAFHPNGRYAYVINELDSTVTAFTWDGTNGVLQEIETVSTLPDDFADTNYCADIHVAPSGKFLYGSNRGHDSIAIFAADETTGRVTPIGYESTQGSTPRNFAIDRTGTLLLAANQNTDTVVTFWIDAQSGQLTPTGHVTEVPTPVCLQLLPVSI